jgi:hypothetical protein
VPVPRQWHAPWFVISARSCPLFNILRTYEVRLPESGDAVSAACMCACLMPTTVKIITELRRLGSELYGPHEAETSPRTESHEHRWRCEAVA